MEHFYYLLTHFFQYSYSHLNLSKFLPCVIIWTLVLSDSSQNTLSAEQLSDPVCIATRNSWGFCRNLKVLSYNFTFTLKYPRKQWWERPCKEMSRTGLLTKGILHLSELTDQTIPVATRISFLIKTVQPDQSNTYIHTLLHSSPLGALPPYIHELKKTN